MHIRGKKKTANRRTSIPVRLLRDLPEYGRKGSIFDSVVWQQMLIHHASLGSVVPIPMGPMRNYYFPARIADYIQPDEMRRLKKADTKFERDVTFGMDADKTRDTKTSGPRRADESRQVRLEQLSVRLNKVT